jgi:NAD(P)H-dependent flavin oxidoreductase YrpB (nitropropane dioxygenase family)
MGVLGALYFTPEELEMELKWIDDHVDGKPYGVDVVMPASYEGAEFAADELVGRLQSMIPEGHRQFVEDLLASHGVPPLSSDADAGKVLLGWTDATARPQVEVALRHPIALLANALGPPPADVVKLAHDHGVKVAALASTPRHAIKQVEVGVDVVVAQGTEAGGHTGQVATMPLVPLIVDAVGDRVPVVAAGGIFDGRGLAAALALGADAAWVGTRLVATVEANAHDIYKSRLVAAAGTDTTLTSIFGPSTPGFNPMRVLRNRVVADYQDRLDEVPGNTDNAPVIGQMDLLGQPMTLRKFSNLVPMPGTTGDFEEMPLLSGQGVGLVRSIEPAGAVVERMAAEAAAIVARLAA